MVREAQQQQGSMDTDNVDMELSQEDQAFLDDMSKTIAETMEPKQLGVGGGGVASSNAPASGSSGSSGCDNKKKEKQEKKKSKR
jgi:hypothetical protein